jgi:hypothetical protein
MRSDEPAKRQWPGRTIFPRYSLEWDVLLSRAKTACDNFNADAREQQSDLVAADG